MNTSKSYLTSPFNLLTPLVLLLFAFQVQANEKKPHKVDDVLTKEQQALLSEMETNYKAYTLADCEDEVDHFSSYKIARSTFSASMAAPPTEVTECCTTGSSESDAEQCTDGSGFGNTDSVLGLGQGAVSGGTYCPQNVGLRFDCYNIPQGAVITSAYIQFTAAAPSTRAAALTIVGEDADNCAPFTAGTPISGRVGTSANVPWSPPTWVAAGDALAAQKTPDITSIIQEIVNRPGYAAGNAICLGISGKGNRRAWSFDSGNPPPELCITYEVPEEVTTCEECPNVTMASLDGVPGFATVDLLNVCSSPDTISLLIYNNGECDLTNVQLTLDFDSGLTYGECVMEHYGGPVPITELDVSNPSQPVFLITQIDSAEAYIVDICVKADCDVDIKSEAPLNFDANLVYSYPDDSGVDEICDVDLTEIGEFNGGVRIPVLNTLSIVPQEVAITNTTAEFCQTITVSQDGIQASLSQYTLDICGLDLVNYNLETISANGTPINPADITVDPATGIATMNINGSMFNANTGAGANGDDIFDVDERMTLTVCYSAGGCTDEAMVPEYKIYYGCSDKICFGVTSVLGAVKFTPNFGANAVANVSNIQYGSICGENLSYEIEVYSTNSDPLDGLWQDLGFKYGACLGNGMSIDGIEINGVPLDASLYNVSNSTLEIDFTTNTDPAYGLSDEDNDGFLDDLPGGQTIKIRTEIAIGCSDSMGACSGDLACSLTRIEVNGKRNCGQDFQQFANLSEPINFFYGNDGTSTNAVPTTGYGLPITEVVQTTCDIWTPTVNGYEFHYDFASDNIGHCEMSGGIKLQAYVQANGKRITDIQYTANSATYQGNPVPGVTWMYDEVPIPGGGVDTIGLIIDIPIGDPTVSAHDYYFNLDFRGDCYPNDYMFVNFKVVEECLSCTDVTPCEIVRACDSASSYVVWRGCGCVCDIRAFVDTIQRCNFGYADKAMTQKLTAADVPQEDLIRFLPGDTMYTRLGFEVLNSSVYYEGNYAWLFDVRYYTWEAPLMPDVYNIYFDGWFHEDISAGTGPLEIGIPDCMLAYDDANRDNTSFPSIRLENMGVEGTLADGGECPDDDINPNYPGESAAAYRIVDQSGADYVNDLSRFYMFFGRDEGCASATPDEINNGCHAALLEQLDLEDGDFFYIDLKIPLVRNPNVSLADINGVAPQTASYLYPYAMTYNTSPGTCTTGANAMTCRTTGQYQAHLPGPISIEQNVCVTDCDTEVEYNFNLQNPLPVVDEASGELPWYENEYRPFMATEYLEMKFPSNMVYLNNGVIVMPDGSEVDFGPHIDTATGNLNCLTAPDGSVCCIAADPSQLAGMRIVDNDYTIGQSHTYYRGPIGGNNTNDHCDVQQLIHVPNDPFPHIPVGGPEITCGYGIKYSLSALCPEDIESGDFQLDYQFADPYVPSLPGSGGPYNGYLQYASGATYPYSNPFRYPDNPYATGCGTIPGLGCLRYYENIVSNPDDSPGSINPMRQTGIIVTGPDNFKDSSMNFPPLVATMQNTLIADEAMINEMNTYTVCADDNGIDMGTHENVVTTLEIPTTIDLIDVCDAAGVPVTWSLVEARPNDNLYSVVNPDLAPGECFEIVIKTELLFCPVGLPDVDVEICVTTVSGCIEPDKAALFTALGETQCDAAGACYEYIAEEAEMQAEWSRDAIGEYPLCETFEMGVRIKNVRPTILTDIEPEFWFPNGLTFVPGSWKVCFPGGPGNYGTSMPIPDPTANPGNNNIYGTNFEFLDDGLWSTYIDQNGMPGVASTLDSNKVEFKFEVETDCDDFVSGTSIWFRADGADPCEMRTGTGYVPTSPIIIDGANPSDFAQFFVFADPLDATCGEPSTITMNFLNISPTGTTDNSMVCMDINTQTFSYMMGSIQWLTPAGHMPMFDESVNGAITHVCFDIPDGIGPGQAFQVSFMFEVPEDMGCGEQDLGVNVSSTVMNTNCMAQGIACDVQVLNSVNPAIQVNFNPPVEVSDQVVTVGCGNGDGTVPVCWEVDLANNSGDYNDDIKIKLIRDLNQNGILEPFDPPLDSALVNVSVLMGDTTSIMGCFDIDENIACPVFLMVMQETNCVCDAQDFYYDSIEPSASDDLGQSIAVCPGSPLKIAYCGDLEYSISPALGATMAPNAAGDSLCITLSPGYGLTNPVVLNVTSQTGGCSEFDFDTEIYSLGNFEFSDYAAEEACDVGCIQLDLDLPTEYRDIVTVSWSPTTFLDDPTSQTPMVCNPTMDVTYTITVNFMENGQMCEFIADYPITVIPQETNELFSQTSLCSEETSTVVGPPGFSNYTWYEVTAGGDIPVQSGNDSTFVVPQPGTYYLEYYNVGDACKTLSASFEALPCPSLVKSFVSAIPTANANEYTVCYEIAIDNNSAIATEYDLYDIPTFDSDITIISASYTSSAGPSGALAVPPPASPGWLLGNDVILAGNGSHTYTLCAVVVIDLDDDGANDSGDDMYSACGSNGGGSPLEGEGLYNEASLDMNEDGEPDETDDACGELPHYTLEKELTNLVQTGPYTWTVTYEIEVCNDGGAIGTYDLDDVPGFDSDIIINGASFSTDAFGHASNPGPTVLAGTGPWDLAVGQDIEPNECQIYTVVVDVTMDLQDPATPGDGNYTACGDNGGDGPVPGEGLYNEAQLDTNGDGEPNQTDDDCGDLPSITHGKELTSITQVGGRDWEVKYTITVENNGGAAGSYGLNDQIAFDDDIEVTCVRYNSDAPGNANNPGPTSDPDLAGPWTLAAGQDIAADSVHTYCIIFCVTMDLEDPDTPGDGDYDACGDGGGVDGQPGEGLYNKSGLDLDDDGQPEEEDEACGDLPNVYHEKTAVSFVPMANGNHMVTYEICVYNNGGADGTYDLYDEPQFDDDIMIVGATYSCDVGGAGSTLSPPVPAGGWLLIDDQDISPGDQHCCTIDIEVHIDVAPGSGGDNEVTECGTATPGDPSPGEALYNESSLDLNNDGDPDEQDEACEDVFMITHIKEIADLTQVGNNEWCIEYNITVTNDGSEPGFYDLYDWPQYDQDITIVSATYSSSVHPSTSLTPIPPIDTTDWQLGNDVGIGAGVSHVYVLEVCVEIDLEDGGAADAGDDIYQGCGDGGGADGMPGEGLYNESYLDTNDDGTMDETDEVCADIPYLTLNKDVTGVVQTGARDFTVSYEITVCNIGGADGEYDLSDQPCFDDDIVINSAEYSSDVTGHSSNPGPSALAGTGPWAMNSGQVIPGDSTCHTYTLDVEVTMDLNDPGTPGDGEYSSCAAGDPADPSSSGGLYNKSMLDTDGDGQPDLQDEACEELPYVTHTKDLTTITQTGATSWEVKYTIEVSNTGGAAGEYDLDDAISFDDDIVVTCVRYMSDAPGNPNNPGPTPDTDLVGPWNLADDQAIAAAGVHTYMIIFCVDMDLNDPAGLAGDGDYTACGDANGAGDSEPGEGLHNESSLDVNNDGVEDEEDEACGDLPHIYHEKVATGFVAMANGNHMVSYEICVYNDGGATGEFDLYDEPIFDDDIEIVAVTYSCANDPDATLPAAVPAGGWLLLDDEALDAGDEICCTIDIEVHIDVAPGSGGDDVVTECGTATPGDPSPGEALYNESTLDLNNDGEPDEMDEACEDVFMIVHNKTIADLVQTDHNEWCITYNITVYNEGNEPGFYDLYDWPQYDPNITMLSAEYSSTVHPNTNLTPIPPVDTTDWQLGNDVMLGADGTHIYTLEICVSIDLDDGGTVDAGDDTYDACGDGGGADGQPLEGLYNESYLDTNDDGTIDETDEVCADLPYFTLEKDTVSLTDTGAYIWDMVYTVEVCNIGGAADDYDLVDQPCFDEDITIMSTSFVTDAPGHPANGVPTPLYGPGPWTLATDQDTEPDSCHVYTITVGVMMNLNDPATPGDAEYASCEDVNPANPFSKGGLHNKTALDADDDGEPDLFDYACDDLPVCEELSGVVFYDLNNNGCQDPGETAVTEIIGVTLYECGENGAPDVPITSTTTIDGEYNFSTGSPNENADVCPDPDKEYYVEFDLPDGPDEPLEHWRFSSDPDATDCANSEDGDNVNSGTGQSECHDPEDDDGDDGDDDEHIDAGIYPCQDVAGEIFYDIDNDGCQEAGETNVVEDVTVNIYECDANGDASGPPVATTTTIDGEYEFGPESPNENADVCLDPAKQYIVEFVIDNAPGSGGALEGWEFSSHDTEVCADSADSDDIDPGTGQSDCYDPNDDDPGDDDDDNDIDGGIYPCQDISGEIFWDINNNGCQDNGETLVTEDVMVELFECDANGNPAGPSVASTTFNDGMYEFSYDSEDEGARICLDPTKNYSVQFSFDDSVGAPLEGQDFSTGMDACADSADADDIDPDTGSSSCYDPNDDDDDDGDDDNDVDAGINPCEEISGEVFVDLNNNGCQDSTEVLVTDPINVSVYECGAEPGVDPPVASTTTIDGEYEFGPNSVNDGADVCLDPVKDYFVVFEIPQAPGDPYEHFEFSSHDTETCAAPEDSDDIDPTTGQSECYDPENDDDDDGDDDNDIDAGIYPCQDVAGEIFYDIDNDGCQEAGETNVVEDVTVNLYECDANGDPSGPPVATTTTIDGEYEFGRESENENADVCLDPSKQYIVEFVIDNAPGSGGALEGWEFSSHDTEVCADSADSDDIDPGTGQSDCYDPNDDDGGDGDDDNDIDGGIFPCQDIMGEIFWDINNNGCQDNGETLVTEDVMVELFECDANGNPAGPSVASTTVNDGMYDFSYDSEDEGARICLDPTKNYSVQFSFDASVGAPLEGQDFSTGMDACADSADADDIDPTTGSSDCYDPNDDDDDDGDDDNNVDAGINPCEEVGGEVFVDLNNNGCQDNGETLVSDPINVSIYECGQTPGQDPPVASTQTIDGEYEFGPNSPNENADVCLDPVKDYFIVFEIPKAAGDPYEHFEFSSHDTETCAAPEDSDDIDPATGQSECYDPEDNDDDDGDDDNDIDAGIYPCQDLSGEIFLDVNNNGCEDDGEVLVMEAVKVEIFECDANGNISGSSVGSITTYDGEYEFGPESDDVGGNVCLDPSKTYKVQFSFDDSPGAPLQGHNFSADGTCADETDADDIDPDTGESSCYNPNDDDGDDGDDDDHVDAGINPCQEISGEVFYDIAGDGCEDGDDTNVTEEVTVTLYECTGAPGTAGTPIATTTTIDGQYMFGEESPNEGAQVCLQSDKQYYVDFDIANGPGEAFDNYVFTNGSGANCAGTNNSDDVDDLTGISDCTHPDDSDGNDDDHIDAGLMELACIGNFVWHDLDGNGIQDMGEPGLSNVIVRLYDGNGNIVSMTTTDNNGYYVFEYLYPGDYYLEFAPPAQYPLSTDPNQGGDTELDSDVDGSNGPNTTKYTTLIPGECDHSWDAGFYNCVPIGELVWYDVDMDNVWDNNENGINGLEVTLYRNVNGNWKKWDQLITGHKPGTPSDDGYYKFCAPPGEYYLHIDLPPYGLVPVRSHIGNDILRDSDFDHGNGPNTTSSFTVRCDEERCDIGAGFYPMASVGDIVWMDDNADGVRQPTEAFAAGVLVEAYDIYNDLVGSDVTDANGNYMIDYLQQEGYYIRIQPPAGYTVTGANVGSDESMDSDIDHSNGNYTTKYYMMDPGVHMPNVDAGLVAGVALPVELISFTGQYRPDYINLSWATATEINTEYFQVEKRYESDDEFVSIGRQLAKGSDSAYDMNDYDVERSGTYYYRLRSIDKDGSEQLSEVISVDIRREQEEGVSIYPNPAVSDVNVEISLGEPKEVSIDLYDTQGKLIRAKMFQGRMETGIANKVIDVQDIPAGVYNLQIQLGSEVLTRRLILLKN